MSLFRGSTIYLCKYLLMCMLHIFTDVAQSRLAFYYSRRKYAKSLRAGCVRFAFKFYLRLESLSGFGGFIEFILLRTQKTFSMEALGSNMHSANCGAQSSGCLK